MPTRLVPTSLDDGGCAFAHNPALPFSTEPTPWRPEVSPATLLLASAPDGFDTLATILPENLGAVAADDHSCDLLVADRSGKLHIHMLDEQAPSRPALVIPIDPRLFELRLEVARRLVRRLGGGRVDLVPAALRLTAFQRQRLVHLLHAFDVHDAGGGPRDVAVQVLNSDQARLPSVEWKDSHTRRKANRLIHDAIALVERDYLKILSGR